LVVYESCELTGPEGRVINDINPLRDQLRYALGIGTGTANGSGPAYGSYRGRIATLSHELHTTCDWDFGVVVTEALYSKQRLFQTVVPLFNGEDFEEASGLLPINDKPWLGNLGLRVALAFIPFVSSAFQPQEIDDILPITVDEGTMEEVDFALKIRFAL